MVFMQDRPMIEGDTDDIEAIITAAKMDGIWFELEATNAVHVINVKMLGQGDTSLIVSWAVLAHEKRRWLQFLDVVKKVTTLEEA